jgi:hypothetical protein
VPIAAKGYVFAAKLLASGKAAMDLFRRKRNNLIISEAVDRT